MDTLLIAQDILSQHMLYVPPNSWAEGSGEKELHGPPSQRLLPVQRGNLRTVLPDSRGVLERIRSYIYKVSLREREVAQLQRKHSSSIKRRGAGEGSLPANTLGGGGADSGLPAATSASNPAFVMSANAREQSVLGLGGSVAYSSDPTLNHLRSTTTGPGGASYFTNTPSSTLDDGTHCLSIPYQVQPTGLQHRQNSSGAPQYTTTPPPPAGQPVNDDPRPGPCLDHHTPNAAALAAAFEILENSRETYAMPNPSLDELVRMFHTHMGKIVEMGADCGDLLVSEAVRALQDFLCCSEEDAKEHYQLMVWCEVATPVNPPGSLLSPRRNTGPGGPDSSPSRPSASHHPGAGVPGFGYTVNDWWPPSSRFQLTTTGLTKDRSTIGWRYFLPRYVGIHADGSEYDASPSFYFANYRAISLNIHRMLAVVTERGLHSGRRPTARANVDIGTPDQHPGEIGEGGDGGSGMVHTLESSKMCVSMLAINNFPCKVDKTKLDARGARDAADWIPLVRLWLIVGAPKHLSDRFIRTVVQDILNAVSLRYGPREHLSVQCKDGKEFRQMVSAIGREVSLMSQQLFFDRPQRLSAHGSNCMVVSNPRAVALDLSKHTVCRVMKVLAQWLAYFSDYFDNEMVSNETRRKLFLTLSSPSSTAASPGPCTPTTTKVKGPGRDGAFGRPMTWVEEVSATATLGDDDEQTSRTEMSEQVQNSIDCVATLSNDLQKSFLTGLSTLDCMPLATLITLQDELLFTDAHPELTKLLVNWASHPSPAAPATTRPFHSASAEGGAVHRTLSGDLCSTPNAHSNSRPTTPIATTTTVSTENSTPTTRTPGAPSALMSKSIPTSSEGSPAGGRSVVGAPVVHTNSVTTSNPARWSSPSAGPPGAPPYHYPNELNITGKTLSSLRTTQNDPWRRCPIPVGGQRLYADNSATTFALESNEVHYMNATAAQEFANPWVIGGDVSGRNESEAVAPGAGPGVSAVSGGGATLFADLGGMSKITTAIAGDGAVGGIIGGSPMATGGAPKTFLEETLSGGFVASECVYLDATLCAKLSHHRRRNMDPSSSSAAAKTNEYDELESGWYYAARFGVGRINIITLLKTRKEEKVAAGLGAGTASSPLVADSLVCPLAQAQATLWRLEGLLRVIADDLTAEIFALLRSVILRDRATKPMTPGGGVAAGGGTAGGGGKNSATNATGTGGTAGAGGGGGAQSSLLYAEIDRHLDTIRLVKPESSVFGSGGGVGVSGGNAGTGAAAVGGTPHASSAELAGSLLTGNDLFTQTAYLKRVEDVLSLADKPMMPGFMNETSLFEWQREKPSRILLKSGLFREADSSDSGTNNNARPRAPSGTSPFPTEQNLGQVFRDGGNPRVVPAAHSVISACCTQGRVQLFTKAGSSDLAGAENKLFAFSNHHRTKRAEGVAVSSSGAGGSSASSSVASTSPVPNKKAKGFGFLRR